jgi:hypothetical protein
MAPFSMDHRRAALTHSPVDVSFLLDAPAGKHGFVKVQDGHLATGDGQRIRFWGVNITDWSKGSRQIPSKDDAAFWAATLARFGVNSVRFQFLDLEAPRGLITKDAGNTRSLDPEQLDREDYFIAELEKGASTSTSISWSAARSRRVMACKTPSRCAREQRVRPSLMPG